MMLYFTKLQGMLYMVPTMVHQPRQWPYFRNLHGSKRPLSAGKHKHSCTLEIGPSSGLELSVMAGTKGRSASQLMCSPPVTEPCGKTFCDLST